MLVAPHVHKRRWFWDHQNKHIATQNIGTNNDIYQDEIDAPAISAEPQWKQAVTEEEVAKKSCCQSPTSVFAVAAGMLALLEADAAKEEIVYQWAVLGTNILAIAAELAMKEVQQPAWPSL
jgi:hypothetical protein